MTDRADTIRPPDNSIEADLQVRAVTLRRFDFVLLPIYRQVTPENITDEPTVDGLELRAAAHELGLTVSLRFERGEFVNIATTGLQMLDAADAVAESGGGGET